MQKRMIEQVGQIKKNKDKSEKSLYYLFFINERVVKNLASSEAIALQCTRTWCALLAAYGVIM
jgi:hypothetical protein